MGRAWSMLHLNNVVHQLRITCSPNVLMVPQRETCDAKINCCQLRGSTRDPALSFLAYAGLHYHSCHRNPVITPSLLHAPAGMTHSRS